MHTSTGAYNRVQVCVCRGYPFIITIIIICRKNGVVSWRQRRFVHALFAVSAAAPSEKARIFCGRVSDPPGRPVPTGSSPSLFRDAKK